MSNVLETRSQKAIAIGFLTGLYTLLFMVSLSEISEGIQNTLTFGYPLWLMALAGGTLMGIPTALLSYLFPAPLTLAGKRIYLFLLFNAFLLGFLFFINAPSPEHGSHISYADPFPAS